MFVMIFKLWKPLVIGRVVIDHRLQGDFVKRKPFNRRLTTDT